MDKTLGFIILRYVKDTQSSKFWISSHQYIRKFYKDNKIIIIAVIVHDSVFINSKIDFYTDTFKFLWHFNSHQWDLPEREKQK